MWFRSLVWLLRLRLERLNAERLMGNFREVVMCGKAAIKSERQHLREMNSTISKLCSRQVSVVPMIVVNSPGWTQRLLSGKE